MDIKAFLAPRPERRPTNLDELPSWKKKKEEEIVGEVKAAGRTHGHL